MLEFLHGKVNYALTGTAGTLAGAAIMALLGWLRIKTDRQIGLTREQRLMLDSTWQQVQDQTEMVNNLQRQLTNQAEYYEGKLEDVRNGYQKELENYKKYLQDRECELHRVKRRLHKLQRHCRGCVDEENLSDEY